MNDLVLLREGRNVWRDACRAWDETIVGYGCHWHNKQGECVGTVLVGTTIVTPKGSQRNLGYASLQTLVWG